MPSTPDYLTLTLDREILESRGARHLRRMRIAIWLYLELLSRLSEGSISTSISLSGVATSMGLPEGTIRSWLGHLRKAGYLTVSGPTDTVTVTIRRLQRVVPVTPARFFTVAKLERALGEDGDRQSLDSVLDAYPDAVLKRALAGALAVPAEQIKKSRTALFLYLAKRYAQEN